MKSHTRVAFWTSRYERTFFTRIFIDLLAISSLNRFRLSMNKWYGLNILPICLINITVV